MMKEIHQAVVCLSETGSETLGNTGRASQAAHVVTLDIENCSGRVKGHAVLVQGVSQMT